MYWPEWSEREFADWYDGKRETITWSAILDPDRWGDCAEHEWERRMIFGSRAWIKTCVKCGLVDMDDKGVLAKEPVAAP